MTMADDGVPCAQQRSCVVKNAAGERREEHFFTRPCIKCAVSTRTGSLLGILLEFLLGILADKPLVRGEMARRRPTDGG